MRSVTMYSAILAAGAGVASAAATCTADILITSPTPTIECDVVDANIRVAETVSGELSIEGPKQCKGDLIITNATNLYSISSTSINSIEGSFEMINLELLSSLNMASLKNIKSLKMQKLPQLNMLTFSPDGITGAKEIIVEDTFINDLTSLKLNTVDTFTATNNHKLNKLDSDLVNITTSFILNNNGNEMDINMPKLLSAGEIQLSNVRSVNVPSLSRVAGSIKFDQNSALVSFRADNLSAVTDSVTFINNKQLTNITFPILSKVGDLTILNNTALKEVEGFPELNTIVGGVILGGVFEKVELPSLKDVKGGVTVTSTTNIESFCSFFDDAKKHNYIQGSEKCTSNNTKANEGGDGGSSGHGSSSTSKPTKANSAVGSASRQMGLALGLAVLAGIAQML